MSDERPLLPEHTDDDVEVVAQDGYDPDDPDDVERLRRERPPHYGG